VPCSPQDRFPLETPQRVADAPAEARSGPLARTAPAAGAAVIRQGGPAARETPSVNLRDRAREQAPAKLRNRQESTCQSVERTRLPAILADGMIRDDPVWE
jgi:hypothetical protein